MMSYALAENGATKVYIIVRREEVLKKATVKYPNYVPSLNLFEIANSPGV